MSLIFREKRIAELNELFEDKIHKIDDVYHNMLSIADTLYNPLLKHDIEGFKKLSDDLLGIVITICELKQYNEEDFKGENHE